LVCAGGVEDVVVPLPAEVVDVDVAAFAIAAPPPAIAAVAAIVTSSGFILRICSPPLWLTATDVPRPASALRRRWVRVG
jgi:hypothetical protein